MMRRLVCIVAAAAALSAGPTAAAGPGTIAGEAEVTPPGCREAALKMPIAMSTDSGGVWLAVRPASVAAHCPAIVYGTTYVYAGPWDPREGGCVPSVSHPRLSMCMAPVRERLDLVTTWFDLCFRDDCWEGFATVVRG